ncbi:MAG: sigma-70 family RNA polymerase sigma factor [Planctomycetes bacterium]|nr:sigma-70 family RNA polymerase sigma factor [Planctomycetota bacterium]
MKTGTAHFLSWVSELVHAHRHRLTGLARKEGLRGEDALDCVQEAFRSFLVLPQARLIGSVPDDAAKILTVITRNIARNERRRRHRSRPHVSADAAFENLPADDTSPDELVAAAEAHAAALGCVETLGQLQQRVVTLRILDDVPGEDVAKTLGITPGHVAVLLHRAIASLRTCMIGAGYRPG